MKSNKIIALLIVMIMICSNAFASANTGASKIVLQIGNPVMKVDRVDAEIDPGRGTVPVIQDGRTLVPIRAIIEALGGSVEWNGEKQEVTLTYKNDVIKLVIGSKTASFNGTESTLDVAPVMINARPMLPIRYIAESFNFDVKWDGETSTVNISKTADATTTVPPSGNENFDVYTDPEDMMDTEAGVPDDEIVEIDPEYEEDSNYEEDEEEFIE